MNTKEDRSIIEQDVIRAFGSSIIEFEAVLYQKFLMISATHSLISEKDFKRILNDMHAKGYITPTEFQQRRCWKRQIVLEDLEIGELTPDEFEQVFKERDLIVTATETPVRPRERIVSNSSSIAEFIETTMLKKLYGGRLSDPTATKNIKKHADLMRKALCNSERDFLEYVRRNTPLILEDMKQILREKGEDVVILGLRLVSAV